jgi:hypothetical protein
LVFGTNVLIPNTIASRPENWGYFTLRRLNGTPLPALACESLTSLITAQQNACLLDPIEEQRTNDPGIFDLAVSRYSRRLGYRTPAETNPDKWIKRLLLPFTTDHREIDYGSS